VFNSFPVIFALRTAPDPDDIKDQWEEFRTRIRAKPFPFTPKGKIKGSEVRLLKTKKLESQ